MTEHEELAEWLERETDDYDDLYPPAASLKLYRAAALLREARPQWVPVAERPWEREGWCDERGRCWWGRCANGLNILKPDWILATKSEIQNFLPYVMPSLSLPHWATPTPTPTEPTTTETNG